MTYCGVSVGRSLVVNGTARVVSSANCPTDTFESLLYGDGEDVHFLEIVELLSMATRPGRVVYAMLVTSS